MNTRPCVAAVGLLALLVLYSGMRSAAATDSSLRELRIHGHGHAANANASDAADAGGRYLYTTGGASVQPATGLARYGDCSTEPPPAAKAAGLTKLAFCDDFSSAATIDLGGTLKDGFKWYITGLPFNYKGSSPKAYHVRDGVLTVHPDVNQAQMSFLSAVVPRGSSTPVGWYIDRQVGGWYAEARIAHEEKYLGRGYTAFWTMDMCHLFRYPEQCTELVEPDFYEFINDGDVRSIHLHELAGRRLAKIDSWMAYHPPESRDVNWRDFNTVALRALPDSVSHYVNDRQVTNGSTGDRTKLGTFTWMGDVVAGPRALGDEVGRYPIIFGSGPEMPFQVDWVKVWVKP